MTELQVILSVFLALGGFTFVMYLKNTSSNKEKSNQTNINTENEDLLLIEKAKELEMQKKEQLNISQTQNIGVNRKFMLSNEVKKLENPSLKKESFKMAYERFRPNINADTSIKKDEINESLSEGLSQETQSSTKNDNETLNTIKKTNEQLDIDRKIKDDEKIEDHKRQEKINIRNSLKKALDLCQKKRDKRDKDKKAKEQQEKEIREVSITQTH